MKVFLILTFLLISSVFVNAQNVFSTQYSHQATTKVFVVDHEHQADLLVYKVAYSHQVKGNKGLCVFTEYAHQTDLKIYFVKYHHQSKWKDQSKIHLLL